MRIDLIFSSVKDLVIKASNVIKLGDYVTFWTKSRVNVDFEL